MLEIMYDIAPGATYKFNTGFLGEQVRSAAQVERGVFVALYCREKANGAFLAALEDARRVTF